MEGYKQCHNSHYYKSTLNECPYCPKQGQSSGNAAFEQTQVSEPTGNNEKTQLDGVVSFDKTIVFGVKKDKKEDFSRTFIKEELDDEDSPIVTIRKSRKLTGWLVSYTIEPMGVDFRIYEGTNTIGRDSDNTITVPEDMSVSSKHVSILSKKSKFYIKDEMAANGTYLNGEELTIGQPYELNDGDEVALGTTMFKFRTSS